MPSVQTIIVILLEVPFSRFCCIFSGTWVRYLGLCILVQTLDSLDVRLCVAKAHGDFVQCHDGRGGERGRWWYGKGWVEACRPRHESCELQPKSSNGRVSGIIQHITVITIYYSQSLSMRNSRIAISLLREIVLNYLI